MPFPTILIVDDDPLQQLAYQLALTDIPCSILTANDGTQALRLLQYARPDLMLLDVLMPRVTGIDVLQAISSNRRFDALKVILLTGVPRLVAPHYRARCSGLIFKPVRGEKLRKVVCQVLSQEARV